MSADRRECLTGFMLHGKNARSSDARCAAGIAGMADYGAARPAAEFEGRPREGSQMDVALFRQALASFLGDQGYRKFIKGVSTGERMRYWQKLAWGRFVSAHPEWAISEHELSVALRVCWVHGAELLPETVKVVNLGDEGLRHCFVTGGYFFPTVVDPGEVPRHVMYNGPAGSELCPCAQSTSVIQWTEGCPFPPCTVVVWYCPECRQAYASEHPEPTPSIDWGRVSEMAKGGRAKRCT